jgi:putative FmdB family regulatory protein
MVARGGCRHIDKIVTALIIRLSSTIYTKTVKELDPVMPIYEYISWNPEEGCWFCKRVFETIQGIREPPLCFCPECGRPVRKLISKCRAAVIEYDTNQVAVEGKINEYERQGMWSHAAELADIHSSKTKDRELKTRAVENYAKAGYNPASLDAYVSQKDK